ncbi:hypothetical protein K5V21_16215 [Clostridium sardiniense]|uniref:Uncharacterized protein n=1 Tax=Clostridium sardiniense TaxID=29369 RepID=A0ABS7L1R5_CLOSR|nr:hypothetical protein [Clostridium sardiniense]MBY0756990.1 hypothetical protein [Clostridium sardiniense]MDQ0460389.1 hypothetical protein [Clostridium sardiniense]
MNAFDIIEILEDNGLTEIQEVLVKDDRVVLEFFYDFDSEELNAAKAYANEESDLEEGSDEWNRDWFIPYLLDIAKDNIESTIEEINDELEFEGMAHELNIDGNNKDYIKFISVFCTEDCDVELEEMLNDYL